MATKRKMRKFAEGDYVTADPSNPVPSIDDDVRARALRYVEGASEESRNIGAPVTRAATKSSSSVSQTVAPPKKSAGPTPESPEEYKGEYFAPFAAFEQVSFLSWYFFLYVYHELIYIYIY